MAASPTNGMLRPALELAWAVARLGDDVRPRIPAPGRLRPLMRFAKLPDRALSTVRQVVDEDDDFRQRVAKGADETELGRAGWLWLVRPDGWDAELATLAGAAGDAALEQQGEKEERSAQRRLRAAEAAVARSEARLAELRKDNEGLLVQLTAERQARRLAEAERDDLENTRDANGSERARLAAAVAALQQQVAALEKAADDVAERLDGSNRERDEAQSEVERLRAALQGAGAEMARLAAHRAHLERAVGDAVARASVAARQIRSALTDAARTVGRPDLPDPVDVSGPIGAPDVDEPPDVPDASAQHPHRHRPGTATARTRDTEGGRDRGRRPPRRRRSPEELPPAMFEDSDEAARYLVRVKGMLLLVDGYNVTLSCWPGVELFEQRHRLVDALAELVTRTRLSVQVVFDGAEDRYRFDPPGAAGRKMRVTFSPEGVDADEVIIDLVDESPPGQPIVVATDDRRVRREVSRGGANVISVAQLLAVLGRIPNGSLSDL